MVDPKFPATDAIILPTSSAVGGRSSFELAQVPRILRKHLLLMLSVWVGIVLAVTFYTLGQPKQFRSEAMLRLDANPTRPLGQKVELLQEAAATYWSRRDFFESECRILKSVKLASAVVRDLGLNADPAFLRFKPAKGQTFKPVSVEDAAAVLLGRLSLDLLKDTGLVTLRYDDFDPVRAHRLLDAYVRIYLARNLEERASMSTSALEWLNGQLGQLQTDLTESEKALDRFSMDNHILTISLEDRHNLISQRLDALHRRITELEIQRAHLSARRAELSKAASTDDPLAAGVRELLDSSGLSTYRSSLVDLNRTYQELSVTLDEQNPRLQTVRAKMDVTSKALLNEIANIRSAAERELIATDSELGELRVKVAETEKIAHEVQGIEIPFNQLKRTKSNNEKIYSLVLERARETELTRMLNFNNIRVVDDANQPKAPFKPDTKKNVTMGILAGLLLGIGAAFGREYVDQTVKSIQEMESSLGITCLGAVPGVNIGPKRKKTNMAANRTASPPELIVAREPDGSVAEALRSIRTNLTFLSPDRPYQSLLVASAVPREGKTTMSCSLAIALAQSGQRVLLVDTDLRRPRVHRALSLPNDLGVSMVVSNQATLEECIQESSIPNLWVLSSGPLPPNPAEILHSERFRELVEKVRAKFDRIVFDSPPVLPVTDAALLGQVVDGAILVVRATHTHREAARRAIRLLTGVRVNVIGAVLNASDQIGSGYGYRAGYYYYRRGDEATKAA